MTEQNTQEKIKRLNKGNQFRKYGGVLGYLVAKRPEIKLFVYTELLQNVLPASLFREELGKKFPEVVAEGLLPSENAIRDFRQKMERSIRGDKLSDSTATNLRESLFDLGTFGKFNLAEQYLKHYREAQAEVERIEKWSIEQHIVPDIFWKAMRESHYYLQKINDLLVQYGVLPPFPANYTQNNYTVNNQNNFHR